MQKTSHIIFLLIWISTLQLFGTNTDTIKVERDTISYISKHEITINNSTMGLSENLIGATPGLYIKDNSSDPLSKLEIQIRGINSLNLDTRPLWVIDGIIMQGINTINDLQLIVNPNDIESIKILKDAFDIAKYGSRGANGVIEITTKGSKR